MKDFESDAPPSRIKLPPIKRVTPKEVERRRKVVARILERRHRIGSIGIRADELVRAVREESEGG